MARARARARAFMVNGCGCGSVVSRVVWQMIGWNVVGRLGRCLFTVMVFSVCLRVYLVGVTVPYIMKYCASRKRGKCRW